MVDLTGKKDAIAIKEEYQNALDHTHEQVNKKVKWLYSMNHKLKDNLALVQKYKKDIVADEDEKLELYATLNNLLVKETNFEKEMLRESKKGKKNTNVTIKPKIKDSDVDDFRINAVQEYLEKYPEYFDPRLDGDRSVASKQSNNTFLRWVLVLRKLISSSEISMATTFFAFSAKRRAK